jgi:putative addiction module killer protein
VLEIVEYETVGGKRPFSAWFDELDAQAAAKVQKAVDRIREGNFGDAKPVGGGVSETRIFFGPGYRVYFGRDGQTLVVLLGGGTKKRQSRDIENARAAWGDYKTRTKGH